MNETPTSNGPPSEPAHQPLDRTTDAPPANESKESGSSSSSEPAFSLEPGAAKIADSARTTDYEKEPNDGFVLASSAASDSPTTDHPGKAVTGTGKIKHALEVPATVAGYEILGILGRGGMGVVYKARQPGLKRLVALKMILAGEHAGERELARFRSEAEAVAQFQHPNIVQIYEVGEDSGRPFFSLEFVEGVSLSSKCNGTPLPPRDAAELLLQLAHGMDYAHQKGIVHRDLKPANILLTTDGIAKITDFGLAKKLQEESGQTRAGTVLGTPSYMPPEQAGGRLNEVGPHSDVYSLGAVLYDLLTGRPPFRGTTMLDTLQMVQTREPVTPIELQPHMPRDLQTICLKCLQKEPSRRYASAADLAEDLRRYLCGEPILARPAGAVERLWRWCRRNPRLAGLSAGIVLLLICWAVTATGLGALAKRNERKAEENEKTAKENEKQAIANEQKAKEEATRADAKAKEAMRNAETAKTRQQQAFLGMVALGGEFQRQLRSRRLIEQLGPQARIMRQRLMDVLRGKMLQMAGQMENKGIESFGTAALHQQLGDLLLRLGEGKKALRQYEEGYRLVEKVVQEKPNSDLARANLGIMLMRLGDIALEVYGDAATARNYYQKGWDLQYEVSTQPRGGDFNAQSSTITLSHHATRLGRVNLAMGHPAEAAKQFEQALKLRQNWADAVNHSAESHSWMMEAYMWLSKAAWHRGDAKTFEQYIREAVRLGDWLVEKYPGDHSFKNDMADVYAVQGEGQAHLGRHAEAQKSYQRALEYLDIFFSHNSDDSTPLPLATRLHELLGADAERRGQQKEAQEHFREALKLRQDQVQLEPDNPVGQAAYLLALAHCGKCDEAAKGADALLPKAAKCSELLVQLARCYAVCAFKGGKQQVHVSKAIEALRALIALDYRDAVLLRTDTDLVPLRKNADFLALVEKLGQDR